MYYQLTQYLKHLRIFLYNIYTQPLHQLLEGFSILTKSYVLFLLKVPIQQYNYKDYDLKYLVEE